MAIEAWGIAVISAYRVSRTDGDVGVGKAIVENGADPRPGGPDAAAEDHAGVASRCGYANEKSGYTSRWRRDHSQRRAPSLPLRADGRSGDADRPARCRCQSTEHRCRSSPRISEPRPDECCRRVLRRGGHASRCGRRPSHCHRRGDGGLPYDRVCGSRACGCRRVPSRSAAVATADIMSPIRQTPEKKLTQGAKPSVCKSRSQSRRPKVAADPSETPRSPQGEAMGIILAVERPRCGGAGRAVTNAIL